MIAGPSDSSFNSPELLAPLLQGASARAVWTNELGGITYELAGATGRRFLKWAPSGSGLDLSAEVQRLRWAVRYTPVSQVVDYGSDGTGQWLLTAALPGSSAVAARWKADPQTAVVGIGRGLRALHEASPVEACPFGWSAQHRVADASRRARTGQLRPADWHPEHTALTVDQALHRASQPPPVDRLVVCHGDACAPNTLLCDDGQPSGNVDLGNLGVADRWADLAVDTWSTEWNYGPGWTDVLLDAYGISRDEQRISYYRLLWDLDP